MPTSKAKQKLKPGISVVGSGRLGTALAIALRKTGYRIDALVARSLQGARKAAILLNAPVLELDFKRLSKLSSTGLVIITTPDDQIERVALKLARAKTREGETRTALHTSGALSSTVLSSLAERGWHVGSIHPLVAVSEPRAGAKALRGAFWCIEGDTDALRVARTIVADLKGQSFSLTAKRKPLYHAAAVMASGNVVALFDVALEMLGHCGLTPKEAQRVLLPLVESTVRNLYVSEPSRALTGTFARGDLATVKLHMEALSSSGIRDALQLYRLLGKRAVALARKNGAKPEILRKIRKALDEGN
jgi:predicted short-subunit dehydrogenase-like oxidoreductase (DUF2520 family)